MKYDPTKTRSLREQYSKQLINLYSEFGKQIVEPLTMFVQLQQQLKTKKKTMAINFNINQILEISIEKNINQPSKKIILKNIVQAYKKGSKNAKNKLPDENKPLIPSERLTPIDYEVITLLQENNYNRIKDCSNSMKDAITYSCTKGIINGWGADKIAYEIRNSIEGNSNMGIVRAKMIARTEIITAYNQGAETQYKAAGLTRKQMIWITAIDERTCDECIGNDEKTIDEIGELPPVHPNCRCSIAPNPD